MSEKGDRIETGFEAAWGAFCRERCSPGAESSAWYREIADHFWCAAVTEAAKTVRGEMPHGNAVAAMHLQRSARAIDSLGAAAAAEGKGGDDGR